MRLTFIGRCEEFPDILVLKKVVTSTARGSISVLLSCARIFVALAKCQHDLRSLATTK